MRFEQIEIYVSAAGHGVSTHRVLGNRIIWKRLDARDIGWLEETRTGLHSWFRRNRGRHLRIQ